MRESQSTIQSLVLSDNLIGDECMQSFGEYLKKNNYVESVDLSINYKITDQGIHMLSQYLPGNKILYELDFSWNKGITDSSIPVIVKIIESSRLGIFVINETLISNLNVVGISLAQNVLKHQLSKLYLIEL